MEAGIEACSSKVNKLWHGMTLMGIELFGFGILKLVYTNKDMRKETKMEQRKIRKLSDNAKVIKITGQNTGPIDGIDCNEDCYHKDPIRLYYAAPYNSCFQSVIIGYNEYYDQVSTSWF